MATVKLPKWAEEIIKETYHSTFELCDSQPDFNGDEAGYIATQAETAVNQAIRELELWR